MAHLRKRGHTLDVITFTAWSEAEAQIVLDQLPAAVKQSHERIIGERRVPNVDKILRLYEADVRALVRGKAEPRWNSAMRCILQNRLLGILNAICPRSV